MNKWCGWLDWIISTQIGTVFDWCPLFPKFVVGL